MASNHYVYMFYPGTLIAQNQLWKSKKIGLLWVWSLCMEWDGCINIEDDFKSQWNYRFEEVKALIVDILLEEEIREPSGGLESEK